MVSETAFFVKDVVGPRGSVSIVHHADDAEAGAGSADLESHTRTNTIRVHHADLVDNRFATPDELIATTGEPDHQELCDLEAQLLLDAIRMKVDLTAHLDDAITSLRIVLAADESIRTGSIVYL